MSAMPNETPERRSYRAETLGEALRLVSDELGPDAIVVRQREGVIGGVGGFFGRRCVELEVEVPPAPAPQPARKLAPVPELDWAPSPEWVTARPRAVPASFVVDLYDTGKPGPDAEAEPEPEAEEQYGWPLPDEQAGRFVPFVPEPDAREQQAAEILAPTPAPETVEEPVAQPAAEIEGDPVAPEPAAEQPVESRAAEVEVAAVVPEPVAEPAEVPAAEIEAVDEPEPAPEPSLELELADEPEDEGELMRTLIAQAAPFTAEYATAYERTAFGRRLADAGLGDKIARDVVAEAEAELRVFDPFGPFDAQVRAALARRIRVARGSRRKRRVIALVGPPGAGKTLTAARLCHAYRTGKKGSIAALSLQPVREAFRLVEHTRALDVPLTAADELVTLRVEIEKLDGAELVIVDTPGVRPGENERLRTLGQLLELVGADETHLLVPASYDPYQVRALVESFSSTLGANRIMITHLDGPGGASAAVAASIDSKLPISFTSTGGSWGLRPADPHVLAELVVR